MNEPIKALIPCAWCKALFTSHARMVKGRLHHPQHCKTICARRSEGLARRGKPMVAANRARVLRAAEKRHAATQATYGELSQREAALVAQAENIGYQRGYHACYRPAQTRKAA